MKWIGIDNSAEAIAVTLRRFAKGLEPMGDFVNGNNGDDETGEPASDTLPLFASVEKPPPATGTKAGKPAHKPVTDFTLFAERSVAASGSATLDQWRTDIGETVPLAVAKESRASYAGERPAKHAKHTKRGSRSPFASFRVFRGHQSSSASVSDPWAAATAHLIKADPILAKIIREVGPCRLKRQKGGFAHLAQAIVNQQLSKAAADSIMKRLIAVAGSKHLTAESFQALSDKALKTAGISARKIGYLRDLAGKVIAGQLDFRRLPRLSDLPAASVAAQAGEEVIRELTQVKGIGRWTADLPVPCLSVNRQARQTGMYLIFVLCRPDVLPLDDTALRSSIADLYRLKTEGNVATIAATGDPWRPFRTVASWYLWSWRNGVSENARG